MATRPLAIKLEQFRQAKRIHGGLTKLMIAALGVRLSRMPIPSSRLRTALFRNLYGKKYRGLDETEADFPVSSYRSLNAFFTRGIKPEHRPIADDARQFLCPCDSTIQDIGRIHSQRIITVKGIDYTLDSLAPGVDTSRFENGRFAVFFLSPVDCHRIFAPNDGELHEAVHVPGYRLLVHPPFQRAEYPVYQLNERMILRFTTGSVPCLLIMVAGWGVGNITLPFDRTFRPRSKLWETRKWPSPISVKRGEWIATFELGSSVVLITGADENICEEVAPNEKVKYGQPVFTVGN